MNESKPMDELDALLDRAERVQERDQKNAEEARMLREKMEQDTAMFREMIFRGEKDFSDKRSLILNIPNMDCRGCNFRGVDLTGSTFQYSDLRGASFLGATVQGCDMRYTNVCGADLREIQGGANWVEASYDDQTKFPQGFDTTKLNRI